MVQVRVLRYRYGCWSLAGLQLLSVSFRKELTDESYGCLPHVHYSSAERVPQAVITESGCEDHDHVRLTCLASC